MTPVPPFPSLLSFLKSSLVAVAARVHSHPAEWVAQAAVVALAEAARSTVNEAAMPIFTRWQVEAQAGHLALRIVTPIDMSVS